MENKPQNIFEKLDLQGEQIEDIYQKIEGVSISDLYALAKRTWDYEDYKVAQKYYNHISLLNPLDWEAPLYASLCNFKGTFEINFAVQIPKQVEKIIISTIKYINNLKLEDDFKEIEMLRCIEIIKKTMFSHIEIYLKNKEDFDVVNADYIYVLEDYLLNVYNEIKNIELNAIKEFNIELADKLLSLIEFTKKISSKITKDVFEKLTKKSSNSYNVDFEKIIQKNNFVINANKLLSVEDIKKIVIHGEMYFEYSNKQFANLSFKTKKNYSILLFFLSLTGIVFSFFTKANFSIFILPILFSVFLFLAAFIQKERIKCNSFFSPNRLYNKVSSDGNIVTKSRLNIIKIVFSVGLFLSPLLIVFVAQANIKMGSTLFLIFFSIILLTYIIFSKAYIKFYDNNYFELYGKYIYLYKSKFYKLD